MQENHCILIPNVTNQEHERQNFTVKKIFRSSNEQHKRRNFTNRNERTEENVVQEPLHRNLHSLKNERRKVLLLFTKLKNLLWNKKTNIQLKRMNEVRSLERFLKTKDQDRKVIYISAFELNENNSRFIISVRTKDCTDCEPTSLRSLIASFDDLKHYRSAFFLTDLA